jgi:hypothetical protein
MAKLKEIHKWELALVVEKGSDYTDEQVDELTEGEFDDILRDSWLDLNVWLKEYNKKAGTTFRVVESEWVDFGSEEERQDA